MSALAPAALRTLAFGDLALGLWGLVWSAGETVAAVGSLRPGAGAAETLTVALAGAGPEGEWRVEDPVIALRATAAGPASDPEPDGGWTQLCRIEGRLSVDGGERALACLGVRDEQPVPDLSELEAFRQVLAWFAEDDALALSAARPRGASGQERDELSAIVFEPRGPARVHDARLSTTYADGGVPARIGLELWLPGEADDEEYPVRAAGEALGSPATARLSGATLAINPMLAHRAGRDGLATYVLARPG